MNIDIQFFRGRSGLSGVFNRDHEVAALRKMGFTGTLSDMRQQFYYYVTGNPWLQDAKALAKGITPRNGNKTFTGKIKGDGDNSRLVYYGTKATPFTSPTELATEVGGGYASVAAKDSSPMYYSTTAAQYVGFLFTFNVGSTQAEALKSIHSIIFNVNTKQSDVFIWNVAKGQFVKINSAATDFTDLSNDVLGTINDCIETDGRIRFLVQTSTAGDGIVAKRLDIDYAALSIDYFK
jgi:hypothetical protein